MFAETEDERKAENRQFGRSESIRGQMRMHRLSVMMYKPRGHANRGQMFHVRNFPLVENLGGFFEWRWTGEGIFLSDYSYMTYVKVFEAQKGVL